MKNMHRILILMLALIMAFGVIEAASAISINFTFNNLRETIDSKVGNVSKDTAQYIVILNSSSTVSNNNVFGFRARRDGTDEKISSYVTMDYIGKKSVKYYKGANVKLNDEVYFKCKKDDSSTYGGPLNACGSIEP